jgi:hypothetical protein
VDLAALNSIRQVLQLIHNKLQVILEILEQTLLPPEHLVLTGLVVAVVPVLKDTSL